MKLLLICEKCGGTSGGTHMHYFYLAKYLARINNDVTVISLAKSKKEYIKKLEATGVVYYNVSNDVSYIDIFNFESIKKALNRKLKNIINQEFDFILSPQSLSALINESFKIPIITKFHGYSLNNIVTLNRIIRSNSVGFFIGPYFFHSSKSSLNGLIDYISISRSNGIIFISNSIKEKVWRYYPNSKAKKQRIIYNGIGDPFITKKKKTYNRGKEIIFSYIGDFSPNKGIFYLLKQYYFFEKLLLNKKINIKTKLLLVGWHKYYGPLAKATVERLNLSKNVRFIGNVSHNNLTSILERTDYVVFPSLWDEPLGNVILESMAFGVPVIASRYGASKEIISDGYDGYLFDPLMDNSLAKIFLKVIFFKDNLEKIGKRAREKALRKFSSWERNARETISFLKKL